MQQRDIDGSFDLLRHPVHGVRADEQEVGARGFDLLRPRREQIASFRPGVCPLQLLDGLKVDAHEGDGCAVQAPAQAPRLLIDQAIVERRAFPAHAAEHADRLHGVALSLIAMSGMRSPASVSWPVISASPMRPCSVTSPLAATH